MRKLLQAFALAAACLLGAAAVGSGYHDEVNHLLGHLERSGCEFFRNGDWHSAVEARAHIEKKYRYLSDKGMIETTEQFIERAASRSSMSGESYRVRCAGNAAVTSSEWLSQELHRFRQSANAKKGEGK